MMDIVEILKESKMHIQAICEDKKFVLDRHEGVFKHQTDKVILLQLEKYEQLLKDINDWLEFMEQSED